MRRSRAPRIGALVCALVLAACAGRGGAAARATSTSLPPTTIAASPTTAVATSTTAGAPPAPTTTGAKSSYATAISDRVVDGKAFDALEADILGRVRAAGLPGASLLVVRNGITVEQEAWLGYAIDKVVPIASGSKWVSGVAIMTVVEEGKLSLDAPISTFVPQLASARTGAITLRQLLSFTSGLAADAQVPCLESGEGTLQTCAQQILTKGLVHPPGEAFRYGSQHLHVAAALAEIVTGIPFADLVTQRVLRPLGMTSTRFVQIGSLRQGLGADAVVNVTHPLPAGGLVSSLTDYGRFLEMLVHDGVAPDGRRIIGRASLVEMARNHTDGVRYASASAFRMSTRGVYGLSHWIDWTFPDGTARVESSDGAFGFRPWIDRQNNLFGVYLVLDQGSGYVDGNPDAPADGGGKTHTSGNWVFADVAKAVGSPLPDTLYPHRTTR